MDSEDKKGGGHQLIQVQLISVRSSSSNLHLLCICSGLENIENPEACWNPQLRANQRLLMDIQIISLSLNLDLKVISKV